MAVDYSSQDFRQSLAAIDAASRDGVISRDGVRVRQHGDTTIMTEHRDPYSFYWQLDKHRRRSESPKRKPPPTDYVIDEEEVSKLSFSFFLKYPSGFSYYWHVDSGTIQREPPRAQTPPRSPSPPPPVYSRTTQSRETQADAPPPPQVIQLPPQQPVIEEHAFKQTTTKRRIENDQESDGEEYGYRKVGALKFTCVVNR
ncbi:hypothetical protein ANCCAN_18426 [Ancylostoma caninum]|uniref:Uncharacterized protein n=1 Tax=Ancylostoma caninum TaxID=29170 RepID=A0A368FW43_ANCCA|nr:hypothetical protein ANCCAN_18426 [Ancylostoma caninum]